MPMKVDPDAAGLDPKRLERIAEHLQTRYLDSQKIAGCQVAVQRHGTVGYFESFGSMDLEQGKPVADDTIWRIYSMTKPITGVALMTLYERGHFQLSDPVHRWLPEFRDLKVREDDQLVEPRRPVSVRDVLMHMSGFGWAGVRLDGPGGLPSQPFRNGTLQTLIEALAERPLRFHPGERWFYTFSTDVCARLVEVMSGQRFDDYLRTEIFEPLQMPDTGFYVPEDESERLAASYLRNAKRELKLMDDPTKSAYLRPPSFLSGGGGLVSTTADYLRFAQMLLNGGELDGVRILGRKTVELMTTNHLPGEGELRQFALPGGYGEVGFDGTGFGLTMAVGLGPARTQAIGSRGEFMWGGYASTIFWVDPGEDLVVVFMTQLVPSGTFNFRGQLKTLVYPSIVD
jgi:CubicO group peptidase (beta-lactamase class C family)